MEFGLPNGDFNLSSKKTVLSKFNSVKIFFTKFQVIHINCRLISSNKILHTTTT